MISEIVKISQSSYSKYFMGEKEKSHWSQKKVQLSQLGITFMMSSPPRLLISSSFLHWPNSFYLI